MYFQTTSYNGRLYVGVSFSKTHSSFPLDLNDTYPLAQIVGNYKIHLVYHDEQTYLLPEQANRFTVHFREVPVLNIDSDTCYNDTHVEINNFLNKTQLSLEIECS